TSRGTTLPERPAHRVVRVDGYEQRPLPGPLALQGFGWLRPPRCDVRGRGPEDRVARTLLAAATPAAGRRGLGGLGGPARGIAALSAHGLAQLAILPHGPSRALVAAGLRAGCRPGLRG